MLFGHLSNHFMDLFHCQIMWTSMLLGSQAFPRSTNAGLPVHSMCFPKRASSADMAHMSRSRWWVWGCPWSQCLLIISPFFSYSQNASLEEDDVRQTSCFSTKNLSGKSQGFMWLPESEMEGKGRKQNYPAFRKSLVSSTLWAKAEKGLQGSPLTKSLFAVPICTYQNLHK